MNLQVSPTRKKHCQGRHLGVQLSKLCEVDVTTIIRIYLADHFMKLFLAHVLPKAFRHGTQNVTQERRTFSIEKFSTEDKIEFLPEFNNQAIN
ncbi:hypothetical protein AAZX31_12G161400 [Glycine max]